MALSSRGAVIRGEFGFRVEWIGRDGVPIICKPHFDRWGEAYAYLSALRSNVRMHLEPRAGGWMVCVGLLAGRVLGEDKQRVLLAREFDAGLEGTASEKLAARRRRTPLVREAQGKPQKPRRKAADALAAIAGDLEDGRTPEERRAVYAATARALRKERNLEAARVRGTLQHHHEIVLESPVAPKKFVMPELPDVKPRESDEPDPVLAAESFKARPSVFDSPEVKYDPDAPMFRYTKEEFFGTDLPKINPLPGQRSRGRPKKVKPEPEKPAVPELPAMFRKLNGRD